MGQQSVESVVILRWKWFRPNKGNCPPMMKTSSCGTVADPTSHWHILTCSDLLNSIGDGSAVTQPSCHTAGPVLRQVLQAQRAPDRIGTLLDQRRRTINRSIGVEFWPEKVDGCLKIEQCMGQYWTPIQKYSNAKVFKSHLPMFSPWFHGHFYRRGVTSPGVGWSRHPPW